MHLEILNFLSESAFIEQRANRHHPSVLSGCLDKEIAVDTAQPAWTPGDAPACRTHLNMWICLRLNTKGMTEENIREENYM